MRSLSFLFILFSVTSAADITLKMTATLGNNTLTNTIVSYRKILNVDQLDAYMRFEGDEILFLLDFYSNFYVSIGWGRQMRFSDYVVIAFRGETAYLTDRHGIG